MSYVTVIFSRILTLLLCLGTSLSFAIATPKFSIVPIPPLPPSVLYLTNTATATYQVTNNTNLTRTLTMVPFSGVTHVGGTCTPPAFTLAPGAGCTLGLLITASQLPSSGTACRTEGDLTLCTPEICKTIGFGDDNPDPFLCSQPSSTNSLNVKLVSTLPPTLTSNVNALALSVKTLGSTYKLGTPRTLTVTNNGPGTATNITYTATPALPVDSTVTLTPANCTAIAAGSACTITITPGATPTTTTVNLAVQGYATNTLNFSIDILDYGSNYQSGLVFAIDDTKPPQMSVSGKIVTATDQVPFGTGIIWSNIDAIIYAIDETSIPATPSPSAAASTPSQPYSQQAACDGKSNGSCNTDNTVTFYTLFGEPLNNYAAGVCSDFTNTYNDWYLPAICEMGYDNTGNNSGCTALLEQNIQLNLVDFPTKPSAPLGIYWSSTEYSSAPLENAWFQSFATGGISAQNDAVKNNVATHFGVRCARIFNPPYTLVP